MKTLLFLLASMVISGAANAQFIATVQLDVPLEEMCGETLYALFDGFDGQTGAKCDLSDQELIDRMNEEITWLREHPTFKAKGVMGVYINCEGKVIDSHSGLKDEDSELSKAIAAFLMENGNWKPGSFNGDEVDCSELIGFVIKKGKISLD